MKFYSRDWTFISGTRVVKNYPAAGLTASWWRKWRDQKYNELTPNTKWRDLEPQSTDSWQNIEKCRCSLTRYIIRLLYESFLCMCIRNVIYLGVMHCSLQAYIHGAIVAATVGAIIAPPVACSVYTRRLSRRRSPRVYTKLLGTSPTISLQPLTSLPGSVSVPRTDNNFSYLAVDLTCTAVGLSRSLIRPSGTRYLTNLKIRRVVLAVLNSSLRQSCSVSTNVTSALEVFLKRYALYAI